MSLQIDFSTNVFIGALVGALGAIIAAVIPLYNNFDWAGPGKRFRKITKATEQQLVGVWIGYTEVFDYLSINKENTNQDKSKRRYKAKTEFKVVGKCVKGKLHVIVENATEENIGWELEFTGGFVRDGFLQVDYWIGADSINQFGTIIYQLKVGGKMEGLFVAHGRDLNRLILGKAELQKQL